MARVPTFTSPTVAPDAMPGAFQAEPGNFRYASPTAAPPIQTPPDGGAMGKALVEAGGKLDAMGDRLAQAAGRIRTREDAVARAMDFGAFDEATNAELRRLQTEADLADPATSKAYADFVTTRHQETLAAHKGSEDSRAALAVRLEGARGQAIQKMAALGVEAGQKRVMSVLGTQLSSLTRLAADDPSAINGLFRTLDEHLDDMAPAMTPEMEMDFRTGARREIIVSALNSVFDRPGGMDIAADLIQTPGIVDMLTPEQQRSQQRRFAAAEDERTAATRAAMDVMTKAETILGRKATAGERMQLAGVSRQAASASPLDKINMIERALGPLTRAQKFQALGIAPTEARTAAGKAIQDREMFISQFGEGSPQVAAFDDAAAGATGAAELTDIHALRKEFTGLSRDFVQVRDAYGRIQIAGKSDSPAGDLSLIFNFMKLLDPGSVVREGEFATAQNSTGIPERIRNMYNKAMTGERLGSEQRADFLDQAGKLFSTQTQSQRLLETQYRGIAKRAGVRAEDVVVDFFGQAASGPSATATAKPGGQPSAAAPTDPAAGGAQKKRIRLDLDGNVIGE